MPPFKKIEFFIRFLSPSDEPSTLLPPPPPLVAEVLLKVSHASLLLRTWM